MKSITILLLHMQHGGIEKQTITLANELSKKYKVNIICTYSMNKEPAYPINNNIEIKYLINDRPNREEFKLALYSKNIIKILKQGLKAVKIIYLKNILMIKEIKKINSDFVLSTRIEFANMLSKYAPQDVVKITQEHLHDDSKKYVKQIKKSFKNLDYLVVLCSGSEQNYKMWLKENKKIKIVKIANILEDIPKCETKLDSNRLIAVGRLHPVKNFQTLIKVFSIVNKSIPESTLTIIGDGEEKNNLKELVKELKLESKINFTGMIQKEQVTKEMLKSDLYVMTSKTECFPMVLLEAEACGLPIVAFDVPVGPREIIKNNVNGYLISNKNINQMAENIINLLSNKDKLKKFGENSRQESYKYTADRIMPYWYKILK